MNLQRGFTLTETMIAFGLMGGLVLGVMKFISTSTKLGTSRAYLESSRDLNLRVLDGLASKDSCLANFLNQSATSYAVTELYTVIKNNPPSLMMEIGKNYGSNLILKSIELIDKPGMDDGVEVVPGGVGSTNLKLTFKKDARNMKADEDPVSFVKLIVHTKPDGTIENCYSSSTGEDRLWKKSAANPDNIYYSGGNVGIGITDPSEKLDIAGSIIANNVAGDRITLGGAPSKYQIYLSVDKVLEVWNEAITPAGPGMLQAGTILADYITLKTSSLPLPCTPGAIRFAGGQVHVCEGTWKVKPFVTWCTPPRQIKKGHDEWMKFHQTTNFRPKGTGCGPEQRSASQHAKLRDNGFRIKYDDRSKSCINDRNCRDYNPEHQ